MSKNFSIICTELMGSLKLGNVWVFIQLIFSLVVYELADLKPRHCLT